MKHSVYTLSFMIEGRAEPVVFYVGHTNNPERREREHMTNPFNTEHGEYDTMKYRWCRSLRELNIDYGFAVVTDILLGDEDSEYAWILRFAHDNQAKGITFYDGLPLTNMRAGDFLSEMLAENVRTVNEVKQFRERKQAERTRRAITYHRLNPDDFPTAKDVRLGHIDTNAVTPEPISRMGRLGHEWLKNYKELSWKEFTNEISQAEKQQQKNKKYQELLADPARQARIRAETERLMREDADKY